MTPVSGAGVNGKQDAHGAVGGGAMESCPRCEANARCAVTIAQRFGNFTDESDRSTSRGTHDAKAERKASGAALGGNVGRRRKDRHADIYVGGGLCMAQRREPREKGSPHQPSPRAFAHGWGIGRLAAGGRTCFGAKRHVVRHPPCNELHELHASVGATSCYATGEGITPDVFDPAH